MKHWKLIGAILLGVLLGSCASREGAQSAEGAKKAGGASGKATATAEGFAGDITLTVTMVNGEITDVTVDSHQETEGIGSKAVEQLPARIKEAGSAEVEVLSGASFSSEGVKAAAREAIEKIKAP